jgi:PAS domain-containing protein
MLRMLLPGCGFGFIYLYGVYMNIISNYSRKDLFISGKSGGAIVCYLSLIKEEHRDINLLLSICEKINDEETGCTFNLNNYVKKLLMYLRKYISDEHLDKIEIITTTISQKCCYGECLKPKKNKPKSIEHLIKLICASCFIPFLSNTSDDGCGNPCWYTVDNEQHIDGAFLDFVFGSNIRDDTVNISNEGNKDNNVNVSSDIVSSDINEDNIVNISTDGNRMFYPPSKEHFLQMYYAGLIKFPNVFFENIIIDNLITYFKDSEQAFVLTDHDKRVIFANSAWCKMSGYNQEEVIGKNCSFLQGSNTDPSSVNYINNMLSQKEFIDIEIVNYKNPQVFEQSEFLNHLIIIPFVSSDYRQMYLAKLEEI